MSYDQEICYLKNDRIQMTLNLMKRPSCANYFIYRKCEVAKSTL